MLVKNTTGKNASAKEQPNEGTEVYFPIVPVIPGVTCVKVGVVYEAPK